MNALVIIDTDALTPATVFAPGGVEGIISKLETDVRAIDRDISTPDGREAVKSLAYKIARSKTALDDMGKELVAGIKAQAATIDAERRTIRERLDALKEEVRGPLTAWETAEAERVAGHEAALVFIATSVNFASSPSAAGIRARMVEVQSACERNWQEFSERAAVVTVDAVNALEVRLTVAEQAERDAAELAELRRLKAEREEADRKAAEAAAAAERLRLVAEAKAAREAQEAEQLAAREAEEAARAVECERERAEQAEADKAAAVAKAIEDERHRHEEEARRVAQQKAAEEAADRKRQENKRHREKVQREINQALIQCGFDAGIVPRIIEAIAAGHIPHLSIQY